MAAGWIARRKAGLTAVERADLRAWLSADPRHAAAFARADAGRDELDWPLHAGAIDDLLAGLETRARQRRRRRGVMAAMAAVVLLAGMTWRWQRTWSPNAEGPLPPAKIVVVSPQRQTLPDGSIIEIRDGAELTVDFSGPVRLVNLRRGAAHFQVAKNRERPFVVRASGRAVRAVGTAFTVELGVREMTVFVTEGTVAVGDPAAGPGGDPAVTAGESAALSLPPTLVDAGNSVVLDMSPQPARAPSVHATTEAEAEQQLAWRTPRLEFSGVALGEVVAMFNRHNRVQLVVADPSLTELKLTGALRADKIDALVQLLESDFQVKAERRESGIILRQAAAAPTSR
jgi:transmembrane sensor